MELEILDSDCDSNALERVPLTMLSALLGIKLRLCLPHRAQLRAEVTLGLGPDWISRTLICSIRWQFYPLELFGILEDKHPSFMCGCNGYGCRPGGRLFCTSKANSASWSLEPRDSLAYGAMPQASADIKYLNWLVF